MLSLKQAFLMRETRKGSFDGGVKLSSAQHRLQQPDKNEMCGDWRSSINSKRKCPLVAYALEGAGQTAD